MISTIYLIVIFLVAVGSFRLIPANQQWIIERMGSYHSTKTTGLINLIPIADRVVSRLPTDPQPLELVLNTNNSSLPTKAMLMLTIEDPTAFTYSCSNSALIMTELLENLLIELSQENSYEFYLDEVNQRFKDAVVSYGIKVDSINLV